MGDIAVVVPSYNSSLTIKKLISQILNEKDINEVIIVDDNSPDNTSKIVRSNFSKNNKVKLIVRSKKDGRGGAVIEGFKKALENNSNKYIFEMDSDFAHNPSDIPRFIKEIKNCDAVFGSRYLRGGETVKFSIHRKIFSKLANLWAYIFLRIRITDYTSGFRCYKKEALTSIDFDHVQSKGFIVLSEIAFMLSKKGFKIAEIPISVLYSKGNKSNFNIREIIESFFAIIKLRFINL